jgi:hypothetical protein
VSTPLEPEVPAEPTPQKKVDEVAAAEVTAETDPDAALPTVFEAAGAEITRAMTVIVSVPMAVPAGSVNVTGIVLLCPGTNTLGVPTVTEVPARCTAVAGATEDKTPRPKAATATSATRLKVVFVDICFLSISRTEEFPQLGLNQISLIRFDESHVLIHQIPHRVSGRGEETYLFVFHLHCLR